ncbi:MAG TPA: phospholipase D family protein [Solirubrobacterales bacterium]|nr:phospholipase D family protein [Solirubrobacterales bacterium]
MGVRLADGGWDAELRKAIKADGSEVRIASPFVKRAAVARLFKGVDTGNVRVLTRFNLEQFGQGVSDIAALRELLRLGARVRGVKRLHAKLYMFGRERAVVTSANLTIAGLSQNHELGVVAEGGAVARACREYFDQLWKEAGKDLEPSRLDRWEEQVQAAQAAAGPAHRSGLPDEGADVGSGGQLQLPPLVAGNEEAFLKFFGESTNRADRDFAVFDELVSGGSHWACTYPKGKRPSSQGTGAVIYMGRLVHSPADTKIYGRAIAIAHEEGRDDASPADIERRPWKAKWPHYLRVHDPEFVAGTLENGPSLAAMMDQLGPGCFASTVSNAAAGHGNLNPRLSIRQQAGIRLAPEGLAWLNEHLERAFEQHGMIASAQFAQLDWPEIDLTAP